MTIIYIYIYNIYLLILRLIYCIATKRWVKRQNKTTPKTRQRYVRLEFDKKYRVILGGIRICSASNNQTQVCVL